MAEELLSVHTCIRSQPGLAVQAGAPRGRAAHHWRGELGAAEEELGEGAAGGGPPSSVEVGGARRKVPQQGRRARGLPKQSSESSHRSRRRQAQYAMEGRTSRAVSADVPDFSGPSRGPPTPSPTLPQAALALSLSHETQARLARVALAPHHLPSPGPPPQLSPSPRLLRSPTQAPGGPPTRYKLSPTRQPPAPPPRAPTSPARQPPPPPSPAPASTGPPWAGPPRHLAPGSPGRLRHRSSSPRPMQGPALTRGPQSRSLDERPSRQGRPPTAERVQEPAAPRGLAQPPTITLRRPSRTCLPSDPSPKCSDLPCFPGRRQSESQGDDVSPGDGEQTASLICFCGFYSERPAEQEAEGPRRGRKVGRCKFCRSKAKYLPGQRSLDAVSARIFGRKEPDMPPLQRALSADPDPAPVQEMVWEVEATVAPPSPRPSPCPRRRQPLHRQHRLEGEEFRPPSSLPLHHTTNDHFPEDIRGYRHIPGPAPELPRFPHGLTTGLPPARDHSPLSRQLSAASPCSSPPSGRPRALRLAAVGRVHSAPPAVDRRQGEYPVSPPPSYEDVLKQPRSPPPAYSASHLAGSCPADRRTLCRGGHSLPSRAVAPLERASAQDIPDIYWEQAARELDFCTCRKCQARYRQYFEAGETGSPSADSMMGDTIIPMETQVFMQEVITDGMAFCSLM